MIKKRLTEDELYSYGTVCVMRKVVFDAKEILESSENFPDELLDLNEKLLQVLIEAHEEYINYMRKVDQF